MVSFKRTLFFVSGVATIVALAERGLALVQSFWVPIYTDEVVWKAAQYRYWQTGFETYNGMLFCPSRAGHDLPWAMKPVALMLSAYYAVSYAAFPPLVFRVIGHATFALTCALFVWLARRLRPQTGILPALLLALLPTSMMFLPYVAILNRPEQELWLAALAFVAAIAVRETARAFAPWSVAAGFVALSALLLHLHPQNAFLFPLYAVAAACCVRSRTAVGVAVAGFLALVFVHSQHWEETIRCPENAVVEKTIALEKARLPSLDEFAELLLNQRTQGSSAEITPVGFVGFSSLKPSYWIRTASVRDVHAAVNRASSWWLLALVLLSGSAAAISGFRAAKALRAKKWPNAMDCAVLALFASAAGLFLLLPNRNFYRGALFAHLFFAPAALALALSRGSEFRERWFRRVGVAIFAFGAALGVASQALLLEHGQEAFARLKAGEAFLPDQPYSFNAFGFDETARKLRFAAAACGWKAEKDYGLVLSDEAGHIALGNVSKPVFSTYLIGYWRQAGDPLAALKAAKAEGFAGDCRTLSFLPELGPVARESNGYCCAGFDDASFLERARPLAQ